MFLNSKQILTADHLDFLRILHLQKLTNSEFGRQSTIHTNGKFILSEMYKANLESIWRNNLSCHQIISISTSPIHPFELRSLERVEAVWENVHKQHFRRQAREEGLSEVCPPFSRELKRLKEDAGWNFRRTRSASRRRT